jgi:pimeloyl-ACP methyl ester carboxylesterase
VRKFFITAMFLLAILPVLAQNTPQQLADPDGQFADVNGASVYYIARGDAANPAVVLIHGFGGSTFTWRGNIDVLAEAGFYVVALDLPPFGLSDKNPELDFSRAGMADTVAGLMDGLHIEKATIVGHSMGGTVTAYFAMRHPERVERLVFVDGGVFAPETSQEAAEEESPLAVLATIDPDMPFAVTLLETLLTPERFTDILTSAYYKTEVVTDEVAAGYQRPLRMNNWAAGLLAFQKAVDLAPVTLENLAEIAFPTLILWGEEDTWIPLAAGETMAAALETAIWMTYPETGHLPMEENTARFNTDLIAFLKGD